MARFVLFMLAACLMAMPALAADGAAAASGPQWFVVVLKHADPATMQSTMTEADANAALMGHIEYMGTLYDKGMLYMAGPFMDDSNMGAGLMMAGSMDDVQAALEQDPGYKAGVFTIVAIHPWMPLFNKPMGMRLSVDDFKKMMAEMMAQGAPGGAPMPVEPNGGTGASDGNMPDMSIGAIGFIEIPSKNVHESQAFYSKVFGWDFGGMMDMSSPEMKAMAEEFVMFSGPDGLAGAVTTNYTPASDSGPVLYINCSSVTAKLAEIEAAGGKTIMASMKLPADWGYIGHFTDPHGNRMGLWSQAP